MTLTSIINYKNGFLKGQQLDFGSGITGIQYTLLNQPYANCGVYRPKNKQILRPPISALEGEKIDASVEQ